MTEDTNRELISKWLTEIDIKKQSVLQNIRTQYEGTSLLRGTAKIILTISPKTNKT